jgi:2-hydroxy-6-oxonona-2,4-dienedioate hydrolase
MALTSEGLIEIEGGLSRYVRLSSGARAHFHTFGRDGVPVVMIHGGIAGSSGAAGWRSIAPYLASRGFQVFCPDMPGFGLADTREQYWPRRGMIDHLAFLEEFVDAVCLDTFHLSGNSLGCINSVFYTVNNPQRVRSLAIMAGGFGDAAPISRRNANPGKNPADGWQGTKEDMRRMMRLILNHDDVVTEDILEMRTRSANLQLESFRALWDAQESPETPKDPRLMSVFTTKGRLTRLDIPTIYVFGAEDRIYPIETGHDQEDLLPNVQFFYPEDCGHQAQTDRPDLVNPLIGDFFEHGWVSAQVAKAAGVSTRRPPLPAIVRL